MGLPSITTITSFNQHRVGGATAPLEREGNMKNTEIFKEQAYRFIARYSDFDGDVTQWRDAFYEVWRHQLTYNFAYEIELRENKNGVFLSMLVRESFKECAEGLSDLGYKFTVDEETAGVINCYDVPDGIECIFVD